MPGCENLQSVVSQVAAHLEILKSDGIEGIGLRSAGPARSGEAQNKGEVLQALKRAVLACRECTELARTRKSVVFGSGNGSAALCFVGEAPGEEEDRQGLPFVGRAGQLLTKMIESIGLKREEVFIANVLKCRPPGNRNPLPDEIARCRAHLFKQLDTIRPRVICALGTFAAQTLLGSDRPISALRGRFYEFRGTKLLATFHPAYLLRSPSEKRKAWEDLKMIKRELAG